MDQHQLAPSRVIGEGNLGKSPTVLRSYSKHGEIHRCIRVMWYTGSQLSVQLVHLQLGHHCRSISLWKSKLSSCFLALVTARVWPNIPPRCSFVLGGVCWGLLHVYVCILWKNREEGCDAREKLYRQTWTWTLIPINFTVLGNTPSLPEPQRAPLQGRKYKEIIELLSAGLGPKYLNKEYSKDSSWNEPNI